jgi:proline iminopeptidase
VKAIILRGVFGLRRRELEFFYQEGSSWFFPDAWEKYLAPIPERERGDLMSAYHRRLTCTKHVESEPFHSFIHSFFLSILFPHLFPDCISYAQGTNAEEKRKCAQAWTYWEMSTCRLIVDKDKQAAADDDFFAEAFARIESHYFVNGGFFDYDGQVIQEVAFFAFLLLFFSVLSCSVLFVSLLHLRLLKSNKSLA